MPGITLEGASAIEVIGGALPKLTERGIIEPEDFPLMRHLRAVVAKDEPPGHALERVFGGASRRGGNELRKGVIG